MNFRPTVLCRGRFKKKREVFAQFAAAKGKFIVSSECSYWEKLRQGQGTWVFLLTVWLHDPPALGFCSPVSCVPHSFLGGCGLILHWADFVLSLVLWAQMCGLEVIWAAMLFTIQKWVVGKTFDGRHRPESKQKDTTCTLSTMNKGNSSSLAIFTFASLLSLELNLGFFIQITTTKTSRI